MNDHKSYKINFSLVKTKNHFDVLIDV